MNDNMSRPLTYQDERFKFLACVVIWLETWLALPGNVGKLIKQTFTSFKHACTVLPQITNHLTGFCGFNYLLTSFLQTDPLEHHFGLYRMMSGSNYHISYLQILETERRLKLSNILKIFSSQQNFGTYSIQTPIESYSSLDTNTLIFTYTNCLLANKVKNYNSAVASKGIEKRKLKKFSHE